MSTKHHLKSKEFDSKNYWKHLKKASQGDLLKTAQPKINFCSLSQARASESNSKAAHLKLKRSHF